jgi:rRNA-processing protein FCF1
MELDDAMLGEGEVYEQHKGVSMKFRDALIADVADSDCDFLITNDERCKKRLNEFSQKCKAMNFNEFKKLLNGIV